MSEGVRQRVNGPAIGLIVTGGTNVLIVILSLVSLLVNGQNQLQRLRGELDAELSSSLFYTANGVTLLLWLGASAFLIFAGLRLRQLKDWVLCVVACFVSLVPCLACCFCVGIPIGIWGLVVLMKDDVKQAFTS